MQERKHQTSEDRGSKMEDRRAGTDEIQLTVKNGKISLDSLMGGATQASASAGGALHVPAKKPAQPSAPGSSGFVPLTSITHRPASTVNFDAIRERLAKMQGKQYWRSIEELADAPAFQEYVSREFPRQAPASWQALDRRDFLKLMGASLALAGLAGCAYQPAEQIIPYVEQPEQLIPGKPLFYASAMTLGGYAQGILTESQMGRPVKIEGNPDHPAVKGRTDVWMQATLYSLYDPDRSQNTLEQGVVSTWDSFVGMLTVPGDNGKSFLDTLHATGGAGLRILTETVTSPTLADQLTRLLAAFPAAKWHQYEPVNYDGARAGSRMAFGVDVDPIYHFDKAKRIVSLDSNFLLDLPGHVRYAADYISGRKVNKSSTEADLNRLYVVESTTTITGMMADHRLPMKASQVEGFARALAGQLGVAGVNGQTIPAAQSWLAPLVKDLQAHHGACLIVPGEFQPPIVHALAHAMNQALGAVGTTVDYVTPVAARPEEQTTSLSSLISDIKAGTVKTLLILGGNPVHNTPADLNLGDALVGAGGDPKKNPNRPLTIHLGTHYDETAALSDWHIPEAHTLEAWGDARAYDGTVSIIQPLVRPLYEEVRTPYEVLSAFLGEGSRPSYDIVRGYWESRHSPAPANAPLAAQQAAASAFDKYWQKVLHDGVMPNTAARPATVTVKANFAAAAAPVPAADNGWEVVFRPDHGVWDGRYANNGWLQELPRPLTNVSWDGVAIISPASAEQIGVANEHLIEVAHNGKKVSAPVWIMPGQPDGSVTLQLGFGRTRAGKIGTDTGSYNAYQVRTSKAPWFDAIDKPATTGERYWLATTQHHHAIDTGTPKELDNTYERGLIQHTTITEFMKGHYGAEEGEEEKNPNLFPNEWPSDTQNPAPGEHIEPKHEGPNARLPITSAQVGGKDVRGNNEHSLAKYPEQVPLYGEYQWGMAIDIHSCIGCNACILGCQSENNIPVVGKTEVARGREMHWLRVDTYYQGSLENPATYFQPRPCMHCEKAPCELVCPVEATSHSAEGINEQTYNRCIGTKYCSNNCPYKVRRFNFLQYSDQETPQIKLMKNPDVTVRSRGVMEKCTYCIQRVSEARIQAEKEERPIRDGEIVTACAQACPTDAIVFGNINDPNSRVSKLKVQPHNYGMLTELNTKPRTTYLARVFNPNPDIPSEGAKEHKGAETAAPASSQNLDARRKEIG
ncbi:MAG: TAT-variant-translocated molybdopterin oxidoreductase [Abitibacteriaceae bacterium]|nr:TAT-variant-translocated molybdopterin oxidoreductase [Abditibacteriaceae bacterium]